MDCALDDVAASVVLSTDADHSMSDVAATAIQSHCESECDKWSGWTQNESGLHDWLQEAGQVPRKAYSSNPAPQKDSLCQGPHLPCPVHSSGYTNRLFQPQCKRMLLLTAKRRGHSLLLQVAQLGLTHSEDGICFCHLKCGPCISTSIMEDAKMLF